MTNSQAQWIGFQTLLKKEILRFVKVSGQTLFSPLVNAGLYLLVFGVSFSAVLKMQSGFSYFQFLVPGLVALSALNNALQNSASSIMVSKFHGDLQDLRIVPLSSFSITMAYSMASVARGLIVSGFVVILSLLFSLMHSGEALSLAHPGALILFLSLSCAIFGNLGITSGLFSKTFDQVNAFSNFVILPLIYLGGVFYSLEILSPFWRELALWNPVLYAINGIRWSVLGVSDLPPEKCLLVLGSFVALTYLFAWLSVKKGSYQRF